MIRFDMIRDKNSIIMAGSKKLRSEFTKQIDKGIKSCPLKETHKISIQISDKPILRRLADIFEIGEDVVNLQSKTIFVRSHIEKGKKIENTYVFEDKFDGHQITQLRNGENIVDKKGSFLHNIVENINKAISE